MRQRGSFTTIGPLAYLGKAGCQDVRCTRRDARAWAMGEEPDDAPCFGWHCSYCDAPCSSMGHRCDAARAVLDEATRIYEENRA